MLQSASAACQSSLTRWKRVGASSASVRMSPGQPFNFATSTRAFQSTNTSPKYLARAVWMLLESDGLQADHLFVHGASDRLGVNVESGPRGPDRAFPLRRRAASVQSHSGSIASGRNSFPS